MYVIKYLNGDGSLRAITTSDKDLLVQVVMECIKDNKKLIAYDSCDRFADAMIHRPEFVSLDAHLVSKKEKTEDPNLDYFFDYVMSI